MEDSDSDEEKRAIFGGPVNQIKAVYHEDDHIADVADPDEQGEIPRCVLSEHVVRGLLTRSLICQQTRTWPLLTNSQMEEIFIATKSLREGAFRRCPDRQFIPTSDIEMGDFYTINRQKTPSSRILKDSCTELTWNDREIAAKKLIDYVFPHLDELLKMFEGKLVAAGGAVFKSIVGCPFIDDVDLFFIDPAIERTDVSDEEKSEKASAFLVTVITALGELWFKGPSQGNDTPLRYGIDQNRAVYVMRNEFVTTVYLASDHGNIKYQFIHRIYPSVNSVLGGFDLDPAKVAYDGYRILAIEQGAWAAMAQTLIVDISRRSTSFEYRIQKYARLCHIVFPGLPRKTVPPYFYPRRSKAEVMELIGDKIASQKYYWGILNFNQQQLPDYNPCYGFVKGIRPIAKDEMHRLLSDLAREHGYRLDKCKLTPINLEFTGGEDQDSAYDDDDALEDQEMLIKVLRDLALENGYLFYYEGYKIMKEWKRHDMPDARSHNLAHLSLGDRVCILRLPMLEIRVNQPDAKNNSGRKTPWTVRPPKDPSIKYEMTDYGSESDVLIVDKPGMAPSDYADTTVWPQQMGIVNLTSLLSEHFKGVVSILCLKHSKTQIKAFTEEEQAALQAIESCIVDLDLSPITETAWTREVRIAAAVTKSLVNPQLGDVTALWEGKAKEALGCRDFVSFVHGMVFGADCNREMRRHSTSTQRREELVNDAFQKGRQRINANVDAVCKNLTGVRWILRNPGTQWTSSINPIVGNPRDWYGSYYRSWRTGFYAIEITLRLIRQREDNVLAQMEKNLFRRIVREIIWAYSFQSPSMEQLTGEAPSISEVHHADV